LDGKIVRGLDWDKKDTKVIYDSLMSYLVLSRLEHPTFCDDQFLWLDKIGYLGTSDIRNVLLDRKRIKNTEINLGSWEQTLVGLKVDVEKNLKKFKGEHLGFVKPGSAEDDVLESLGIAKKKFLKRDLGAAKYRDFLMF